MRKKKSQMEIRLEMFSHSHPVLLQFTQGLEGKSQRLKYSQTRRDYERQCGSLCS